MEYVDGVKDYGRKPLVFGEIEDYALSTDKMQLAIEVAKVNTANVAARTKVLQDLDKRKRDIK